MLFNHGQQNFAIPDLAIIKILDKNLLIRAQLPSKDTAEAASATHELYTC